MKITRKNEKNLILSDAIVCAILKVEADLIGITLEEYVDRFLEVFYNEPQKFYSMLTKRQKINNLPIDKKRNL